MGSGGLPITVVVDSMRGIVARWLAGGGQVFLEAGGAVPDRNVECLLSNKHIPVNLSDNRRLVSGHNVANRLPLFGDIYIYIHIYITIPIQVSRTGEPRSGTSNPGGRPLEIANNDNKAIYRLLSLGLGTCIALAERLADDGETHLSSS